jgi:hypothetical protein
LPKFATFQLAHDVQRRSRYIVAALAVSAMLAACGGGDDGDVPADSSSNPTGTQITVPQVYGLSQSAAISMIKSAGLTVGKVTKRLDANVPLGNVISQTPSPGNLVASGSAVSLFVSAELGFIGETDPEPGDFVPDAVSLLVRIQSTYEISEVIASAAGREAALSFIPDSRACTRGCPAYVGTLSLAGLPMGSYTITVRARDVRGNTDELTIAVVHDNPPVLSITQPVDRSVVLGSMPIDARCTDDAPGCVVEVMFDTGVPASSPAALVGSVDFSGVTGGLAHLFVRARDSANQVTQVMFSLYFEGTGRLSAVAQMPGEIRDANAAKLLFLRSAAAGGTLGIYDRASGTTEDVPLPAGQAVSGLDARLTPSGAVFQTSGQQTPFTTAIHLWRLGALTTIPGSSGLSASPSGNFALSSDFSNLYLTDTGTGASTLVSSNAGSGFNDVLDDGTVFFWTTDYQLVRYRAGQQTMLTNDPNQQHVYPLADDTGVVFRRRPNPLPLQGPSESIGLIEGGQEIVLAGLRESSVASGRDYQRNAGWTAYTDLGAQGQKHVFTRSPQHEVKRLTDLATTSEIVRLGSNGEVMIRSAGGRYLGDGSRLLPVSSTGESFQIAGEWYVAIGSTFLAVDSD